MTYRLIPQLLPMSKSSKHPAVFSLWGWMSQMIFSLYGNPKEVGSNPSEGMDLEAKVKASREIAKHSSISLYWLLAGVQMRSWLSQLKTSGLKVYIPTSRSILKVCFPISKIFPLQIKKNKFLKGVPLHFEDWVNSKCSQVDNQE